MFANVEESHIAKLLDEKDSVSTKRTINRSVSLFRTFLIEKRGSGDFEGLSKQELNENLRLFYVSIRTKSGTNLKVSSLNSIKYGLSKYLKDNCKIDIHGSEFHESKVVFKAAITDMKKKGFGSVDHKPAISTEDLNKLFNSETIVFNVNTPCGLQSKVWFDLMFYLCRRGRENLRKMTKETFGIETDAIGREYVFQAIDEADKNHGSNAAPNETIGEGRMYAQPQLGSMCPVNSFKKYLSKLHKKLDALWQRPLEAFSEESTTWFCRSPLGKNTLASLMSEISKKAKLSRIYTNHSIRATAITAMDEAGIEARHIMRASGHKNESSIRSYACRLNEPKKRQMSDCLSSALGTVNKNPTESHIDQENSISSLTQEDLDAIFNDTTFDEISSSSSSFVVQQQQAVNVLKAQSSNMMPPLVCPRINNSTVNFNFYAQK
ncbi:uncharacterized protein LOC128160024 [Crassostrea angulata]|uniref:uncharacterized protein LOC128160024 n=1 Tax=Magallana angulata TaxID=2784310 RepID=UPI0022B1B143|nr:uncharacterized protein LOC128160024 [Crassostrea angulata]